MHRDEEQLAISRAHPLPTLLMHAAGCSSVGSTPPAWLQPSCAMRLAVSLAARGGLQRARSSGAARGLARVVRRGPALQHHEYRPWVIADRSPCHTLGHTPGQRDL